MIPLIVDGSSPQRRYRPHPCGYVVSELRGPNELVRRDNIGPNHGLSVWQKACFLAS
jgi:hypothetical protein